MPAFELERAALAKALRSGLVARTISTAVHEALMTPTAG
jgi:hypothetical protein